MPEWFEAIRFIERVFYLINDIYEPFELPQGKTNIGYKWIFEIKLTIDRTLTSIKIGWWC